MTISVGPTPRPLVLLDPLTSRDDLRAFAADQEIDFAALIASASQNFVSPIIYRQQYPLSDNILESMFDDDQRALGRLAAGPYKVGRN